MHTEILPRSVAMIVLDADGLFQSMNSAAEHLLGDHVIDFITNWQPTQETTRIEFTDRSIRVDMLKTHEATYLMLFDDGSPSGMETDPDETHRDLKTSFRARDPQQERDLLHVKSKSTAMIAHQFGTPISAIRLKSYLLRKHLGSLSKERITEHLEQIEAQLDQMVDLLDDLVLVNQVYSAEQVMTLSPLDLEAFSKKILDQMALDWSEREIGFSFSGSLNNVQLDRRLVRYVLANLVGGVLKYSGSSVHLDIRRADKNVTFTVVARDVVISAYQLEKILVQLSLGSGSGALSGTGLSLSVMKTCVEMYGGTITVESKPGKGTSFVVSLPCRSI